VDICSYKIQDGNSRIVAEIKQGDSKIPYGASMIPGLESSSFYFAPASTWLKRLGHQNMEYIKIMPSNELEPMSL